MLRHHVSRRAKIVWNEENLENNIRMKEEEGYATMKIDEVRRLFDDH